MKSWGEKAKGKKKKDKGQFAGEKTTCKNSGRKKKKKNGCTSNTRIIGILSRGHFKKYHGKGLKKREKGQKKTKKIYAM